MLCQKTAFILLAYGFLTKLASVVADVNVGDAATGAGWLSVVIQLGSFGLIAYLIIKGLPALQKEIMEERKVERADFQKTINDQRVEFINAITAMTADRKSERADFNAALLTLTEASRKEAESIRAAANTEVRESRTFFAQEQRETRALMQEMSSHMRSAVHDMKNTAQQTMNKAAVAIEVAKVKGDTGNA